MHILIINNTTGLIYILLIKKTLDVTANNLLPAGQPSQLVLLWPVVIIITTIIVPGTMY